MDNLTLTQALWTKWLNNLLLFLRPVLVLYIVAVIGLISMNNGKVDPSFFVPNPFVWGGITLYFLNAVLDYLRKLKSS